MAINSAPQQPNDLLAIWTHYVHSFLTPQAGEQEPPCKTLVADEYCMRMINIACPMTQLMDHRVYEVHSIEKLVEDQEARPSVHDTAYVLIRPTPQSQDLLIRLLQLDVFSEYHVAYSNRSEDTSLVGLAMHDVHGPSGLCKIHSVRDMFADFAPLDRHLFAVPRPPNTTFQPSLGNMGPWKRSVVECVTAVAAALRCSPIIRFQHGSAAAADIARNAAQLVKGSHKSVYDFQKVCTVLVLDRFGDALTPLLMPWTYEGLMHELLDGGIVDNSVMVRDGHKQERVAIGPTADWFYAEHAGSNYGEVSAAISAAAKKTLVSVQGLKAETATDLSVAQMRQKLDQSAESSARKGVVARHMNLFETIADRVDKRGLLEVGITEQNLAAGTEGSSAALAAVRSALALYDEDSTTAADVQRIALLATLRHEDRASDARAAAFRASPGVEAVGKALLEYGGSRRRGEDLWGGLLGNVRRMMKGGSDMSAYMRHSPLLQQQLNACADGRLDARKYPVAGVSDEDCLMLSRQPASQIVVIMLGGLTYSEGDVVRRFNAARLRAERKSHAVAGATTMLSTQDFVRLLEEAADS